MRTDRECELDVLIIKLWDKANGQPDYDKKEWQKLQLAVEDLQRQLRLLECESSIAVPEASANVANKS